MALPDRKITTADTAFDLYLQAVELTEPPLIFHRWCFISAISTLIGRNVFFPFGDQVIYPNQYIILVGNPATKKSFAINLISKLMVESGYEHFAPDRSSKEKFMLDWEFGFDRIAKGEEPGPGTNRNDKSKSSDELFASTVGLDKSKISEAYIKSGELQDFLGGGNADFIVTLTNLWDNLPKYTDRFKNSASLYIPNPTLNLLGGCTATTFSSIFSSNIAGQGMLSRLLLVYGGGQRHRITVPPAMDLDARRELVEHFLFIRTKMHGAITMTAEAYDAFDEIYQKGTELPDSRLATYANRRQLHFIKLMMVTAIADCRMEIGIEDVILAHSLLTYTETYMPKALGEFGKSKNSAVSQVVLETIQQAEDFGGITGRDLFKAVAQDVEGMNELMVIISKLGNAGKIKVVEAGELNLYMPIRRKVKQDSKFINMNLLWEYRLREAD